MIKYLLFSNSQKKKSTSSLKSKKKSMSSKGLFAAALMMVFAGSSVKAQTTQVMPSNSNSTGSYTGPYANSVRIYQLIMDDTQLTALSGKYIKSLSFRLGNTSTTSWPANDVTYPSYDIYLSNGVDPSGRQLTNFDANVVGPRTQVRSGSLLIPANSLVPYTNPNPFSFDIEFTTPYLYTGTNLVIEIRHSESNGTSVSNAAESSSTNGFGSLFTSCWASTLTPASLSNGNFSAVKINALDNMGVKSVEIGSEMTVFPNPVKDVLNVKSTSEISELYILNAAGQKIHSQKTSSNAPQIPVSNLVKGIYFLQTLDKNGNMKSTKFIKD